jgi:hypothetical protein
MIRVNQSLTMGIIQMLTEQHMKAAFRTGLSMMSSEMANKATAQAEEQIGVVLRQMGESVESKTVHGGREKRSLVKGNPVGMMVIGHGLLNYPKPLH